MSEPTTDVVVRNRFTNDELREIDSAGAAVRLLADHGMVVTDLSEILGSGFDVLDTKEKSKLVNVEFLILDWHFSMGDKGEFVSLSVVARDGRKFIVNDGSTGIKDQIKALNDAGYSGGILVRKGLRASEYWMNPKDVTEKSSKPVEGWERAVTYYLGI